MDSAAARVFWQPDSPRVAPTAWPQASGTTDERPAGASRAVGPSGHCASADVLLMLSYELLLVIERKGRKVRTTVHTAPLYGTYVVCARSRRRTYVHMCMIIQRVCRYLEGFIPASTCMHMYMSMTCACAYTVRWLALQVHTVNK